VIFHNFADGQDEILETFPETEEGEVEAKEYAVGLFNIAWGE
jgi:hypothetical protein